VVVEATCPESAGDGGVVANVDSPARVSPSCADSESLVEYVGSRSAERERCGWK
jgi:hypothetical protein